jgi:multiple sugar transport system permease protein
VKKRGLEQTGRAGGKEQEGTSGRTAQTRRNFQPYLFIAPALLVMIGVALYPLLFVLWLSLRREMPIFDLSHFVGWNNYVFLWHDPRFWHSLANTLYFTAISVTAELLLGLLFALVLHRRFRGRGWVRAAVLVPWMIPTVVAARMWEWLYNPHFGLFNYLLRHSGLIAQDVNWLGDPVLALHAAIMADVWKATPFATLLLLAGLEMIPEDLYRAARVDGAGAWSTFYHLTLPLLRPMILTTLLFRTLDALRVFDIVYVLTGGGPANTTETLSIYAYRLTFHTLQFGYGASVAVVTFGVVLGISLLYLRLLRQTGEALT